MKNGRLPATSNLHGAWLLPIVPGLHVAHGVQSLLAQSTIAAAFTTAILVAICLYMVCRPARRQ